MGKTYKDAGVDIEAGDSAVRSIKEIVKTTYNDNVLSDVGLFGGFYSFPKEDFNNPVLVSSTDGVGTKLKIAFQTGVHHTVGQDLVNHCVDDILTSGAVPMFFLDYLGTDVMREEIIVDVIKGFSQACRENSCVLIGGEMAEMGDFYQPGEYDLAGTIVGVVERDHIIDGTRISEGDVMIGLPSTGLHTNGYTLARNVLLEEFTVDTHLDELGETVGEALLAVHKSYLNEIKPLIGDPGLKGLSHITGGGLLGNTQRILPDGLSLQVDWNAWDMPPIFQVLQNVGDVADEEMRRAFNCGIGFVVVTDQASTDSLTEHFRNTGADPVIIGNVVSSE
ncbi:MAG: phosphoribosylformylglycinamidine cyclo-ligase [Candidatus Marinimicrobia bacterium]|nr:phosphoribosylformylglycinamidine cyclo-ligase [Candidatus Neomarinimicrobiota bacterium]